jgi:5-oxoprolinase (ATP-hydrolysing)
MIRIHTVAAGGGSVLRFARGRFQAGPASAGASPGPASYGNDGPLAVTDANLYLGRLLPDRFPQVFGPDASAALDRDKAAAALGEVVEQVFRATGEQMTPETVAEGFLRVAVDNMANAIKTVSTQRGHDPAGFTLCCFGGAGGQHACDVADALGIRRILIHPMAGVLSAYGMGTAPLQTYRQRTVDRSLTGDAGTALDSLVKELAATCSAELVQQGVTAGDIETSATLLVRVPGSDTTLPVTWLGKLSLARRDFAVAHEQRYGFVATDAAPIVETLRVSATGGGYTNHKSPEASEGLDSWRSATARTYCNGAWQTASVHDRASLPPGTAVAGPAIVAETTATTVVMPGWTVTKDQDGLLVLDRKGAAQAADFRATRANPVLLELFNNHCMNVAEQMGAVLENTAHSVNIKERRDFSCALFDGRGQHVANAPHIPVHLGSMSDSVRAVLKHKVPAPGESWLLNDPYQGGTHLPDITVVTPFYAHDERDPLFLLASRAHHADVGGLTPGSMPATSRSIEEEGIRFEPFAVVHDGRLQVESLLAGLESGPYPARNPQQNLADIQAQLAANEKGIRGLRTMLEHFGEPVVRAYLEHVQDNAEAAVREAVRDIQGGSACVQLDDGAEIRVEVRSDPQTGDATIDFSGTGGPSPGNLNAPRGISHAAVLYTFRCLVTADIPLNEGCLRPLDIRIPKGSLLSPVYPAAVAAGNVETSQCIANALFQALGVLAAGQGTMNNLSFGDDRYQYYETIGGGAGASAQFDGASGVHTHMTNSRITDPEILETRYPVLVREFALRRDSGGKGRQCGGDGLVRALEFTSPMHASVVANHRAAGPPGLAGGEAGKPGINMILRADDSVEYLPAIAEADLAPGDVLVIATPGGGGYGRA